MVELGSGSMGRRPGAQHSQCLSTSITTSNIVCRHLVKSELRSVAHAQVPVVIRGPGGVGRQLGAEHSQRLESYFQSIPGVQLVACSTVANAKALLKSAIRSDNPIIFFEHVLLYNVKGARPTPACACLRVHPLLSKWIPCVLLPRQRPEYPEWLSSPVRDPQRVGCSMRQKHHTTAAVRKPGCVLLRCYLSLAGNGVPRCSKW